MDLFTPEFKSLKARRPLPDFSSVIDIDNIETQKSQHKIVKIKLEETNAKPVRGFKACDEWNVYRFPDYPGFIVIQNPFQDGYERYWISRCLQDFSADKRNSSNLTNLGHFDYFDAWEDFVSKQSSTFSNDDPLWKLRWVTLGYHYGWQTKEYSEDRKAEFPPDVQCLSQYFSQCLGLGPFRAEAGIVNYYRLDSTLGGHTDHSEIDHTAPLLSFSFGQTCVFLLGGPTKETKPMAIYLRSGDVCVMSKEARLAYHAVPKILSPEDSARICPRVSAPNSSHVNNKDFQGSKPNGENNCQNTISSSECKQKQESESSLDSNIVSERSRSTHEFSISDEYLSYIDTLNEKIDRGISDLDWRPYEMFLQSSRINMNMRQVLPPGYKIVEPNEAKVTNNSIIETY